MGRRRREPAAGTDDVFRVVGGVASTRCGELGDLECVALLQTIGVLLCGAGGAEGGRRRHALQVGGAIGRQVLLGRVGAVEGMGAAQFDLGGTHAVLGLAAVSGREVAVVAGLVVRAAAVDTRAQGVAVHLGGGGGGSGSAIDGAGPALSAGR